MPSILSRLSSLVPDFRPFRTPSARGTVRPRPGQDERIPTRAGVGRTWFLPYADSTSTDDTPDIRAAMRKMLRDPYVKSAWLSQVLSVLSQPIQVHAPKGKKNRTDQDRADFVRHCLEHAQDGMLGVGTAVLMNHGSDGYTVSEKVWHTEARGKHVNKLTLRALKPKDLDEHGRLIGDEHNNVTGVWSSRTNDTYPITDFVYTRYLHTFDEPMGMAAFRPSYGAYWSRDTVRKLRIIHKEKNLDGLLLGTYEDPADKSPLEAALARARSSTWLSIPAGVRVEMLSKSQAAEGDYKSFDESLREESLVGIALAHLHILQGGVSDARGNTKVHKAVADLGPWLLTYIIQYAINRQIVPDLIDYNYGYSDEYPQVTLGGVSNAEVIELLQVLEGAQRAGFKPSKSYYATELTIQEADPTDPEDLLSPPQAAPPGGGMGGPGGMDLGGMLGGGGGPFGGGGAGGGLPPGPPALPPAPAAGGEFGAFRECGPKGGYEEFAWDDWTQQAGGKWKSPGGRVLSDAVFQRMRGKGGGAKAGVVASKPAAAPTVPPTVRADSRPIVQGNPTPTHGTARPTEGQQADKLVRMLTGTIGRSKAEIEDAASGVIGWDDSTLTRVHHALYGGPMVLDQYERRVPKAVPRDEAIRGIVERVRKWGGTVAGSSAGTAPMAPPPSPPSGRSDYTLSPQEYRGLKARLTIAVKSGDPSKVKAEVRRATAMFDKKGYPDDWSRWERAADDAEFAKQRSGSFTWRFAAFGETGHIETFGWDDWQPRDQYMVSPGGRVLKRDTWERMKSRTPQGGGPTTANGRTTPPAGRAPQPPDRNIQARLAKIRGNPAEALREVEGDVRAAAAELATNPPDHGEVVDLVAAATPGLDATTQQQLGTHLADATAGGTPEKVKSGFRRVAEWAAGLTGRAAVWAVRGLLTVAKKLLLNTTASLAPPGIGEVPGKVARTFPSVLKYVGVIALSAGIFAASIAAPVLLPVALSIKLGIAAVTLPAGAAWVAWGMRKALKPVGREVIEKWTGYTIPDDMKANPIPPKRKFSEGPGAADAPQAGEEIALAGKDGKRAAELMGKSQKLGRDVLARVTEQAVARLLADPEPLDNSVLFTDEELQEIADSLAATTAAADLLGRGRVRRMVAQAEERMQAFAEESRPTCPKCGQKGTFARTTGDANALCNKCGKFTAPLPTAKFSEGGHTTDPFDVFAEPLDALPPTDAVSYFRKLIPSIQLTAERYAPLLGRQAFTLAVAADQSLLARVKTIILDQLEAGRRPTAVADIQDELDAAGITPRNPQYAEMVYRTNMNDSYMQGFSAEMADPGVQRTFPVWQYLGIRDGRQGEDHEPHFDRYYHASRPFAEVRGPRVFNCLLPGSFVQGRFTAALKARYAGEAVEITTRNGHRLAITVNHPVLTEGGFVAAGDLAEGQRLLHYRGESEWAVLGEHDEHAPALIDDVFQTFQSLGDAKRLEDVAALDLHGDGQFVHGQVEVVRPDCLLWGNANADAGEGRGQCDLAGAAMGHLGLPSGGPPHLNLDAVLLPTAGGVGGGDLTLAGGSAHPGPLQPFGVGVTADGNTCRLQPRTDGGSADPERVRKLLLRLTRSVAADQVSRGVGGQEGNPVRLGGAAHLDARLPQPGGDGVTFDAQLPTELRSRFPGLVAPDEIVQVRRWHYDGPVYDMETDVGYFVAGRDMVSGGIIISNCRCSAAPVTKFEWADLQARGARAEGDR